MPLALGAKLYQRNPPPPTLPLPLLQNSDGHGFSRESCSEAIARHCANSGASAAPLAMGMPVRIFDSDSDDNSPQRKRRRSVPGMAVSGGESVVEVSDSDEDAATDSAPELSVHEILRHVSRVSHFARRREWRLGDARLMERDAALMVMRGRRLMADSDDETRRSAEVLGIPHDLARRRNENMWYEGIDLQAMQDISHYYTSHSAGKGQLNLVKTAPDANQVSRISVVYADETPQTDVGRWWMVGTWPVDGALTAEMVFQTLMDVLTESASIARCKISTLVVCDGLENVDGVQGGIQLLKDMARNRASQRRNETRYLVANALRANLNVSDGEDPENGDQVRGFFTHPVTGDRIDIAIE